MNSEIERLLEILERELEEYGKLEDMITYERDLFRRPNIEKIEEQLGMKAQVVTRIHRLETERKRVSYAIAASQGLDGENIRLIEMLRNIPNPWAGRLKEVRDHLKAKATRVNKANEWNQQYIQDLLSMVDGVLDRIRSAFAQPPLYEHRGQLGKSRVNGGEVLSHAV